MDAIAAEPALPPPAFAVEPTADGVRYRIVPPPASKQKKTAFWALLIMGTLVTAFMVFWMYMPISRAIRNGLSNTFDYLTLGFGLLGLPGLAVGLALITFALYVRFGRTVIEIADGKLSVIDSLGALRWRRSRPVEAIHTIETHGEIGFIGNEGQRTGRDHESESKLRIPGLRVRCHDAKPMPVLVDAEPASLRALAESLAERVDAAGPAKLVSRPAVQVVEAVDDVIDPVERDQRLAHEQPADTTLQLERRADGLTVTVPAAGVFKSKAGFFGFGLIWCAFMSLFTFMVFITGFKGEDGEPITHDAGGLALMIGMFVLFWAVGIGMLLAGWNQGRRHSVIDVVGDTLLFTQVSLFGTREYEWRADQIKRLAWATSDIESNDEPVMCLRIEPTEGKARKLLLERDDEELQWLAAVLRLELGISHAG